MRMSDGSSEVCYSDLKIVRRAPDNAVGNIDKLTECVRFPDTKAGPGRAIGGSGWRAMKLPELSKGDLSDRKPHGFDDRTPLWFYILREAQVTQKGKQTCPRADDFVRPVRSEEHTSELQSLMRSSYA